MRPVLSSSMPTIRRERGPVTAATIAASRYGLRAEGVESPSVAPSAVPTMIAVEAHDPSDDAEWDAFLTGRDDGLFWYSAAYRALLRELLPVTEHSLVAREGDRIVGALPLFALDGPFGRVYNSLPYYGGHGGVLAASRDVELGLAAAYRELATANGTVSAAVVSNPFGRQDRSLLPRSHGDDRVSQFTPLDEPDRAAFTARWESRARWSVRKAEAAGVVVTRDASALEWLINEHTRGMASIGAVPKERRFFELAAKHLPVGDASEVWVARHEDRPIAAVLVFYFNGIAEYFTPAVDPDMRSLQPLSLLVATAMFDAVDRGCRIWNWGGTAPSLHSLFLFKRQWGSDQRTYGYDVFVNDDTVLDRTSGDLLAGYPHFFVAPFSALRSAPAQA
jgi:hypothetical protein